MKNNVNRAVFRCELTHYCLTTSCSHLENEGFLRQIGLPVAEVFHFIFISLSEIVKPQAVAILIHNRQQLCLKQLALCGIQQALKDGILHPLAIVDALLSDLPQPPTSR